MSVRSAPRDAAGISCERCSPTRRHGWLRARERGAPALPGAERAAQNSMVRRAISVTTARSPKRSIAGSSGTINTSVAALPARGAMMSCVKSRIDGEAKSTGYENMSMPMPGGAPALGSDLIPRIPGGSANSARQGIETRGPGTSVASCTPILSAEAIRSGRQNAPSVPARPHLPTREPLAEAVQHGLQERHPLRRGDVREREGGSPDRAGTPRGSLAARRGCTPPPAAPPG